MAREYQVGIGKVDTHTSACKRFKISREEFYQLDDLQQTLHQQTYRSFKFPTLSAGGIHSVITPGDRLLFDDTLFICCNSNHICNEVGGGDVCG